jgi:hypothetical protein
MKMIIIAAVCAVLINLKVRDDRLLAASVVGLMMLIATERKSESLDMAALKMSIDKMDAEMAKVKNQIAKEQALEAVGLGRKIQGISVEEEMEGIPISMGRPIKKESPEEIVEIKEVQDFGIMEADKMAEGGPAPQLEKGLEPDQPKEDPGATLVLTN